MPRAFPHRQAGNCEQLPGRQGRRTPPRPGRCPQPGRCPVRGSGSGISREGDMPAARPGPSSPGRTSPPAVPGGTSGTAPIRPSAPRPRRPSGTAAARPTAARASRRCGTLHPGRPCARSGAGPGCAGSKNAAIAAAKSRSACCCTIWRARGQPRVLGPRLSELPALLQVARRARPARVPVPVLLHGQVPHVPGMAAVAAQHRLLGGGGEQPVPRHANTLATTTDISEEVKRRFLPGLKAGVSTPRS